MFESEHGTLPAFTAPPATGSDDAERICQEAQACVEAAQRAPTPGEAAASYLQAHRLLGPLIKGQCSVGVLRGWALSGYSYALGQGMDCGVPRIVFNLDEYRPQPGEPGIVEGMVVIAELCERLEDNLEALRLAMGTRIVGMCFQMRGIYEYALGQLEMSGATLLRSIELLGEAEKDHLPVSYDALGSCRYHMGELEVAVACFERAAGLDDDPAAMQRRRERLAVARRKLAETRRGKCEPVLKRPPPSNWVFGRNKA